MSRQHWNMGLHEGKWIPVFGGLWGVWCLTWVTDHKDILTVYIFLLRSLKACWFKNFLKYFQKTWLNTEASEGRTTPLPKFILPLSEDPSSPVCIAVTFRQPVSECPWTMGPRGLCGAVRQQPPLVCRWLVSSGLWGWWFDPYGRIVLKILNVLGKVKGFKNST